MDAQRGKLSLKSNEREACQTTIKNALFEFMYSTGCRIGEVVKLNRHDIDYV